MLHLLKSFLLNGRGFLMNHDLWKSLDVDYFPPRVERLFRTYGGNRYYLHRIHHTTDACLFHKHRWPSAVFMIDGAYEMGIAHCEADVDSVVAHNLPAVKTILTAGSSYEMLDRNSLHYVRPLTETSMSVMVSGPLFSASPNEKVNKELFELSPDAIEEMLQEFQAKWPRKIYLP